jgi:hypothetical protein
MTKGTAAALGVLLVLFGIAGVARAESWIRLAGTIQTVDCRNRVLVLDARDGRQVFTMARSAAVSVNSAPVRFCTLEKYVGSYATIALVTGGTQTIALAIDVGVPAPPEPGTAATPPVTPAPTIEPDYSRSGPSIPVNIGVGPAPW